MNNLQQRRLILLGIITGIIAIVLALILFALKQNLQLYFTPDEIIQGMAPINKTIRVGGMVVKDSVNKADDLQVEFVVTDLKQNLLIKYRGILPDLFRVGQGIVAKGALNTQGVFIAQEILAKHDSKYMPRELQVTLAEKN